MNSGNRTKIVKRLALIQKIGESVSIFFKISGIPHIYVARIIAVNESFVCLEGSHPLYFDDKDCQIEEIRYKGKTIYRAKRAEFFSKLKLIL